MTVQQVFAHDYTSAKTYSWDDMDASGSWEKVKVIQYVFPIFTVSTYLILLQG